jgi:hypothetical protein
MFVIIPLKVNDEVLNAIVTDHYYYPETSRVEILAGYMAEPGKDFYELMSSRWIRKIVQAAILDTYETF